MRSAILITAAAAALAACLWSARANHGDFGVYCAGLRALDEGADVYNIQELIRLGSPTQFPMPNPAIVLPILRPACNAGSHVALWTLFVALALCLVGLLDRGTDWPLLACVMFAGFAAYFWMLDSGNIAPMECVLVGGALISLSTGRRGLFSGFLGAAGFLKLIPVVLTPIALLTRDTRKGLRAAIGVGVWFVVLYLIFFAAMPRQFIGYWSQLLGLGGHIFKIEAVAGGETHPSLFSLAGDLSHKLTGRTLFGTPIYAVCAAAIVADLGWYLWSLRRAGRRDLDALAPLAALCIILVLPRLKPYTFNLALVPLYVLLKPLAPPRQLGIVAVACVFPLAAVFFSRLVAPFWFLQYAQLFSLAGAYLLLRANVRDTIQE